jgi:hypothetical protein
MVGVQIRKLYSSRKLSRVKRAKARVLVQTGVLPSITGGERLGGAGGSVTWKFSFHHSPPAKQGRSRTVGHIAGHFENQWYRYINSYKKKYFLLAS